MNTGDFKTSREMVHRPFTRVSEFRLAGRVLLLLGLLMFSIGPGFVSVERLRMHGGVAWAAATPPDIGALKGAAEKGDPLAAYLLGEIFYKGGAGIPKNSPEARKWFEKAADKGVAPAQFRLADMLIGGEGGFEDPHRGVPYLMQACSKGYPPGLLLYSTFLFDEKIRQQGQPAPVEMKYAHLKLALQRHAQFKEEIEIKYLVEKAQESMAVLDAQLSDEQRAKGEEALTELDLGTPPYSAEQPFGAARSALPEGEPAISQEDAQKLVDELIPIVEKVAKRKFRQPPRVRMGDRTQVARSLSLDIQMQIEKLHPSIPLKQVEAMAQTQGMMAAPSLLGKYGVVDKTLYLLPRNIKPLCKIIGMKEEFIPAVLKLVLAHELTHALQDQQVDLNLMMSASKSPDENMAFSATIEGHALFVQDGVTTELDLDKEAVALAKGLTVGGDDESGDQDLEQRMDATVQSKTYKQGRAFIEAIYDKGKHEKIWEVLAHPPYRTSMIFRPETYDAVRKPLPDYAGVLKGIERYFGKPLPLVQNIEIGRLLLESVFVGVPASKREGLIEKVKHVQAMAGQSAEGDQRGTVALLIFLDAASAAEYAEIMEETFKKDVIRKSPPGNEAVVETLPGFSGGYAKRMTAVLQGPPAKPGGKPRSIPVVVARVVRGALLAEVESNGFEIPATAAAAIAGDVLPKLETVEREFAAKNPPVTASASPPAGTGGTASGGAAGTSTGGSSGTSTGSIAADGPADPLGPAIAAFQAKDLAKTRTLLIAALKENPKNAKGHFLLAVVAAKEKRFDDAWQAIDAAAKLAPKNEKVQAFIKRLEGAAPRKTGK